MPYSLLHNPHPDPDTPIRRHRDPAIPRTLDVPIVRLPELQHAHVPFHPAPPTAVPHKQVRERQRHLHHGQVDGRAPPRALAERELVPLERAVVFEPALRAEEPRVREEGRVAEEERVRHAHRGSRRDGVAGLRGRVGVDGGGDGGDAGAAVGDGDADAEGFLDDGPEVGLPLQGGEVVAHAVRTVREGGPELLLQEPEAARLGQEFVGGDGDGPGGAEGGGDDEHLGVLLEAVEGFFRRGQMRAAEDLVEDGVVG